LDFRRRGTWFTLLLAAGLAAFLIERLVVTDEEAIRATIDGAVAAVEHGDFEALREAIDEEYREGRDDRDAAVRRVESLYRTFQPTGLDADVVAVTVNGDADGDRADVRMVLRARSHRARVTVAATMVRRGKAWKVLSAVPVDGAWGIR
jgi:predicted lipid-binding transport protein (Tim44 family)